MIATNTMARRVTVANAVVSLIPLERKACTADDEYLARLNERLGDLAYAYRTGTQDVADELLKLTATCMAFLDKLGEEAAR